MRVYRNLFNKIINTENLFSAWEEFQRGKTGKKDVLQFEKHLEQEIFRLHRELKSKTYRHGAYKDFYISDPKLRHIHKATVRDRVLHHAVFQVLQPIFESTFIPTSFSCQIGKGTLKGIQVTERMARKVSKNYTQTCYILKCDVRKFFDSVDHEVLLSLIQRKIKDTDTMWLMTEVVESFLSEQSIPSRRVGIPIGNLTSQVFANLYMNELDQYMKQQLKVECYCRYTDDFLVISRDKAYLEKLIGTISQFLKHTLKLTLHPNKIEIRTVSKGVDFLGHILLPHYRLMRKRTLKRIKIKLRNKWSKYISGILTKQAFMSSLQSYIGLLSHASTHKLTENLKNQYWFWINE